VRFVFQAEDGIRDRDVTGVQTCALPISSKTYHIVANVSGSGATTGADTVTYALLINGVVVSEVTINNIGAMHNVALSGFSSVTGATSYICKLQMKTGVCPGYWCNTGQTLVIHTMVFEQ